MDVPECAGWTAAAAIVGMAEATMRPARYAPLFLLIFLSALPSRAFSLNWQNGLSGMGASLSDTAGALMQQELQQEQLGQQHQQRMQEIQAQHDLQMQEQLDLQVQRMQEQQRQLQIDVQRAQQQVQRHQQDATTKSRAVDAAQLAHLVRAYPDWRSIVGAPTAPGQQPDLTVPFRRWLATKDQAYQAKINSTKSFREVERAITLFRAQPVPAPAQIDLAARACKRVTDFAEWQLCKFNFNQTIEAAARNSLAQSVAPTP